MPREYRQNTLGRSGKSPWVKIRPNIFSCDKIAENFHFFVLSITYWNISCLPSIFFSFSSHVVVLLGQEKNLPIGFGTIFVEFITTHSMFYIIRKHFLRLFQKYKVHGNLMILLTFMMIHHFCGQNGSFTQKN